MELTRTLNQIKLNLFCGATASILTLSAVAMFKLYAGKNNWFFISPTDCLILFIYFFFGSFEVNTLLRRLILLFPITISIPQQIYFKYSNYNFYLPAEILELMHSPSDVLLVLKSYGGVLLSIVGLALFFAALIVTLDISIRAKSSSLMVRWLIPVLVVAGPIVANRLKFPIGKPPTPIPTDSILSYLTASTFIGRILPTILVEQEKAVNQSPNRIKIQSEEETPWKNIVVVVGESLSARHLSLLGYARKTTPFLESLKENHKEFEERVSLSLGTSTNSSLSLFFNLSYGLGGIPRILSRESCLFKFAKDANFKTHFISIQARSSELFVESICKEFVDTLVLKKDFPASSYPLAQNTDLPLIQMLSTHHKLHSSEKNFFILQQRGSHAPWKQRYQERNRKFPEQTSLDHYDNSVVEFDYFMKELIPVIESFREPTLLVYFSDHGESLGYDGLWGHGFFNRAVFETPLLILSFSGKPRTNLSKLGKITTHHNIGLILITELGYNLESDPTLFPRNFEVINRALIPKGGAAKIQLQGDGKYKYHEEF